MDCPRNRTKCPVDFDASFCASCEKFLKFDDDDEKTTAAILAEASKPALEITVKKDGTCWVAYWSDFINLQESPAGYGETPEFAVRNLIVETGIKYV